MNDPFEVLGLPPHADEAEVRRRYLELVREFSPERAPERFAVIRAAYDQVRDPVRRLESQIFRPATSDTLEALAEDIRTRLREARVPLDVLLSLADSP
jgi:curved DNA-binding protein CbpA